MQFRYFVDLVGKFLSCPIFQGGGVKGDFTATYLSLQVCKTYRFYCVCSSEVFIKSVKYDKHSGTI